MNNAKIRFPLFKGHKEDKPYSWITLGEDGHRQHTVFIKPNSVYSLQQIVDTGVDQGGDGTNPRGLDPEYNRNIIIKDVMAAWETNSTFSCSHNGIGVIVDNDSFRVFEEEGELYVEFSCEGTFCGHYDGQHSMDGILRGQEKHPSVSRPVKLHLLDRGLFPTGKDIRDMSADHNRRQAVRVTSEMDQAGLFNDLKSNLNLNFEGNIKFKENQQYPNGEKIRKESEVNEVYKVLAWAVSVLSIPKFTVHDICKFPKVGADAFIKKLAGQKKYAKVFEALKKAYPHVNDVLELVDYIQESLAEVWEEPLEELGLVYEKKKLRKLRGFSGAQFEGALNKDLRPMLAYAMMQNCYEKQKLDDGSTNIKAKYTLTEMKAIWNTIGYEVLRYLNELYNTEFEAGYSSRWSDFVADMNTWVHAKGLVQASIQEGAWKNKLDIKLKEAA